MPQPRAGAERRTDLDLARLRRTREEMQALDANDTEHRPKLAHAFYFALWQASHTWRRLVAGLVPGGVDVGGFGLGEDRAERRSDVAGLGLGDMGNTFRLASRKDWDALKYDVKPIYTAVNAGQRRRRHSTCSGAGPPPKRPTRPRAATPSTTDPLKPTEGRDPT